jgi:nucleotide-binding universal stress UspA family protein
VTRVLIAVDETDESVEAAQVAHRLFGDDADYLVVNVSDPLASGMAWGYVYPIVPPIAAYPVMMPSADAALTGAAAAGGATGESESAEQQAEQRAADVAGRADLGDAQAIGDVGDAANAILEAALEHAADVIVVGSHDRSWFDKLVRASVAKRVLNEATIPVLVVK